MTLRFDGRVALITGAGGGIGRAHAIEIARRGGKVVVNDLGGDVGGRGGSASMAEQVVEEIRAAGGEAVANHDSVATSDGAKGMVAQAVETFGRIDVLINNAGIMRNTFFEDITDEDWDAVIGTHLTGSFRVTRAAWPHMKAQGYGRIVFTGSSAGMLGIPMVGAYAPAKAGVTGLMNICAHEGAPFGILCNALLPNAASRMAMQAAADWARINPETRSEMPGEVGNSMNVEFNTPLAVYLASEACTDTHGMWSQCLGRAARMFVGTVPGWQAQRQSPPTVEEIAAHWDAIRNTDGPFFIPESPHDEQRLVLSGAAGQD